MVKTIDDNTKNYLISNISIFINRSLSSAHNNRYVWFTDSGSIDLDMDKYQLWFVDDVYLDLDDKTSYALYGLADCYGLDICEGTREEEGEID